MLKGYIKIAFRTLFKNRIYFAINTLGLSISLTVSFLMLLWVFDESGVDKFHQKDNQLYAVKRTMPIENEALDVFASVSYPMLKTAKEELPEIEEFITIGRSYDDDLRVNNVDYRASGTFTNAAFFKSFSFPILLGDITQFFRKFCKTFVGK